MLFAHVIIAERVTICPSYSPCCCCCALKSHQATYKVEPYMTRQEDINSRMRAILIDWLVEVHMKFRLVPETLYLCVSIIDRYCSKVDVLRSKLQLIGVTALLVACKHEEIYPPEVRDCVYITDRAYNRQEVLDMEQEILKVLDWKISTPTAYPFLDRFLSLTDATEMTKHAASYYLERTLQEHSFLQFRPSLVTASAVILALNNPDIQVQEEDLERELPGFVSAQLKFLTLTQTQFELTYISSHTHLSSHTAENFDGVHWFLRVRVDDMHGTHGRESCGRANHCIQTSAERCQEKVREQ